MTIRRRGVDTSILLRNHLTRVGVEMWYKIYSPNVEGIEVVQRASKRARRNKLTYLRKPKHDIGSVQNIVAVYSRQRGEIKSGGQQRQNSQARRTKNANGSR
jgi:large subunit ribosomal protein L19